MLIKDATMRRPHLTSRLEKAAFLVLLRPIEQVDGDLWRVGSEDGLRFYTVRGGRVRVLGLPAPWEWPPLQAPARPVHPPVAGKRRTRGGGGEAGRLRPGGRPRTSRTQGVTRLSSRREDRVMVEEQTLERPTGVDVGTALLDEYMELKGELGPLEKRRREVRDRLRECPATSGSLCPALICRTITYEWRCRTW